MGYRSDVGLCLTSEAQAKLEAGLLNLAEEAGTGQADKAKQIREFFQAADTKKDEAGGAAAYYWTWLKWFDDYPEVAFVEAFKMTWRRMNTTSCAWANQTTMWKSGAFSGITLSVCA